MSTKTSVLNVPPKCPSGCEGLEKREEQEQTSASSGLRIRKECPKCPSVYGDLIPGSGQASAHGHGRKDIHLDIWNLDTHALFGKRTRHLNLKLQSIQCRVILYNKHPSTVLCIIIGFLPEQYVCTGERLPYWRAPTSHR